MAGGRPSGSAGPVAFMLPVAAVIQTASVSAHWVPLSGQTFERVGAPAANRLAAIDAEIPPTAETIVSQGVVGRFAQRRNLYPYLDVYANGQTVPLYGSPVYVILVPSQGVESESPQTTLAAVALMRRLGAVQLVASNGVYAFQWHGPHGVHSVTFPPWPSRPPAQRPPAASIGSLLRVMEESNLLSSSGNRGIRKPLKNSRHPFNWSRRCPILCRSLAGECLEEDSGAPVGASAKRPRSPVGW